MKRQTTTLKPTNYTYNDDIVDIELIFANFRIRGVLNFSISSHYSVFHCTLANEECEVVAKSLLNVYLLWLGMVELTFLTSFFSSCEKSYL